MLGRRRGRTGQAGQSLVELIIAILLLGTIFLSLAGALTAINRGTATNEKVQSIDSAMLAYGEIIRTQVAYQACVGNMADTYQGAGEAFITGNGQPGANANWRRPTGMVTEVIGVESWNSSTKAFENRGAALNKCLSPDTGVQRVSIKVTFNGTARTAQVVKRKSCLQDQALPCP